jgi:ABC-type phosphonate transport system ATPase subunit
MSSLRPSSEFTRASIQFAVSGVGGVAEFRFDLSPNKPANILLGPSGSGKTLALSLIAAGMQGCLPEREASFERLELIVNGVSGVSTHWITERREQGDGSLKHGLLRECPVNVGVLSPGAAIQDVPIRRVCYLSPFADPGGLWPVTGVAQRRCDRIRHALDRFPFRQRLQRLESEVDAFGRDFAQFEAALAQSPDWETRFAKAVADSLTSLRSILSEGTLPYLRTISEPFENRLVEARVAVFGNRTSVESLDGTELGTLLDGLHRRARSLAAIVSDSGDADAERTLVSLNRLLGTMDCRFRLEMAGDGTVELVDDNGDPFPAETVSSGVVQALDLWTAVALASPGTLLLIDDPETGMDVRWRSAFLRFLLNSLSERACWAIVATQCPAIVHNRIDLIVEPSGDR